jgi:hypothetical protein
MSLRSFHSPEEQLFFDGQRLEQIHRLTMKIGHMTQTNKELAGPKRLYRDAAVMTISSG